MHLICSYCGRYIKEKKPYDNVRLTHGICLDCFVPASTLTDGFSCDEYVETFEVPVIIMDFQQKVLAANRIALAMLEKSLECLKGMPGGVALGCRHSKLPEGCGRTIYCQQCTIRTLILKTLEFRISFHNELVTLETEEGKSNFLVTSIFYDDLVQIVFEDCRINATV